MTKGFFLETSIYLADEILWKRRPEAADADQDDGGHEGHPADETEAQRGRTAGKYIKRYNRFGTGKAAEFDSLTNTVWGVR